MRDITDLAVEATILTKLNDSIVILDHTDEVFRRALSRLRIDGLLFYRIVIPHLSLLPHEAYLGVFPVAGLLLLQNKLDPVAPLIELQFIDEEVFIRAGD
mgnify:CR=1 FL=1